MPIAVVIDGAYFLRRFKSRYPSFDPTSPKAVAFGTAWLAAAHLEITSGGTLPKLTVDQGAITNIDISWAENPELYRIFFYDCPPLLKRVHLPISRRTLDLAKTETARSRLAIHEELLNVRKVALRLGRLNDKVGWRAKPEAVERWVSDPKIFGPTDEDFEIDTVQKGVDMRLGLDIAAMAFKRQISQLILVAGDADFVPAVKLARREGIDVVLDPMGGTPAKDLIAHVDGIRNIGKGTK